MSRFIYKYKKTLAFRLGVLFVLAAFTASLPGPAYAQTLNQPAGLAGLPTPGTMLGVSPVFAPPLIKGLVIHPENPLQFDFLIDPGNADFRGKPQPEKAEEYRKLVKYFLAALTVPEEDLWVNLSPYEKDRIIADNFGKTEMGRDLLGQDYVLKQLAASLMYPEKELGKKFWDKVYKEAQEKFGTIDIPVNTFNKVWIIPDSASVYEKDNTVFLVESHLKVMLEEDYVALDHNSLSKELGTNQLVKKEVQDVNSLSSKVVREVIIPAIEKEVNEGKNFALLRQINNSLILATWYKTALKESLLGKVYVNRNKTDGVDQSDIEDNQKIYAQYLEAFKNGVYNYIKEEYDPVSEETIPRKYFSGGYSTFDRSNPNRAMLAQRIDKLNAASPRDAVKISRGLAKVLDAESVTVTLREPGERAMMADQPKSEKKVWAITELRNSLWRRFAPEMGKVWDEAIKEAFDDNPYSREAAQKFKQVAEFARDKLEFADQDKWPIPDEDDLITIQKMYIVILTAQIYGEYDYNAVIKFFEWLVQIPTQPIDYSKGITPEKIYAGRNVTSFRDKMLYYPENPLMYFIAWQMKEQLEGRSITSDKSIIERGLAHLREIRGNISYSNEAEDPVYWMKIAVEQYEGVSDVPEYIGMVDAKASLLLDARQGRFRAPMSADEFEHRDGARYDLSDSIATVDSILEEGELSAELAKFRKNNTSLTDPWAFSDYVLQILKDYSLPINVTAQLRSVLKDLSYPGSEKLRAILAGIRNVPGIDSTNPDGVLVSAQQIFDRVQDQTLLQELVRQRSALREVFLDKASVKKEVQFLTLSLNTPDKTYFFVNSTGEVVAHMIISADAQRANLGTLTVRESELGSGLELFLLNAFFSEALRSKSAVVVIPAETGSTDFYLNYLDQRGIRYSIKRAYDPREFDVIDIRNEDLAGKVEKVGPLSSAQGDPAMLAPALTVGRAIDRAMVDLREPGERGDQVTMSSIDQDVQRLKRQRGALRHRLNSLEARFEHRSTPKLVLLIKKVRGELLDVDRQLSALMSTSDAAMMGDGSRKEVDITSIVSSITFWQRKFGASHRVQPVLREVLSLLEAREYKGALEKLEQALDIVTLDYNIFGLGQWMVNYRQAKAHADRPAREYYQPVEAFQLLRTEISRILIEIGQGPSVSKSDREVLEEAEDIVRRYGGEPDRYDPETLEELADKIRNEYGRRGVVMTPAVGQHIGRVMSKLEIVLRKPQLTSAAQEELKELRSKKLDEFIDKVGRGEALPSSYRNEQDKIIEEAGRAIAGLLSLSNGKFADRQIDDHARKVTPVRQEIKNLETMFEIARLSLAGKDFDGTREDLLNRLKYLFADRTAAIIAGMVKLDGSKIIRDPEGVMFISSYADQLPGDSAADDKTMLTADRLSGKLLTPRPRDSRDADWNAKISEAIVNKRAGSIKRALSEVQQASALKALKKQSKKEDLRNWDFVVVGESMALVGWNSETGAIGQIPDVVMIDSLNTPFDGLSVGWQKLNADGIKWAKDHRGLASEYSDAALKDALVAAMKNVYDGKNMIESLEAMGPIGRALIQVATKVHEDWIANNTNEGWNAENFKPFGELQPMNQLKDLFGLFGILSEGGVPDKVAHDLWRRATVFEEDKENLPLVDINGENAVANDVLNDHAMMGRPKDEKVGGIDLNPANLNLQIKRDGNGVALPLPMQDIPNINVNGFIPVIINIQPIFNLPQLLGVNLTQKQQPQLSSL